jgi:hypothetical protein
MRKLQLAGKKSSAMEDFKVKSWMTNTKQKRIACGARRGGTSRPLNSLGKGSRAILL